MNTEWNLYNIEKLRVKTHSSAVNSYLKSNHILKGKKSIQMKRKLYTMYIYQKWKGTLNMLGVI